MCCRTRYRARVHHFAENTFNRRRPMIEEGDELIPVKQNKIQNEISSEISWPIFEKNGG